MEKKVGNSTFEGLPHARCEPELNKPFGAPSKTVTLPSVSMSRKGNPWDNAACESFMKTLKYEEVFRSEYRDLQEAHLSIREFLEKIYNESGFTLRSAICRLRSSKPISRHNKRKPLRGVFLHEF